jgi:hypothetical protein
MASRSSLQIEELNKEFQRLIQYVSEDSQSRTAHEVELKLFRDLLKLGKGLLALFFSKSGDSSSRACESSRWNDIRES